LITLGPGITYFQILSWSSVGRLGNRMKVTSGFLLSVVFKEEEVDAESSRLGVVE
jgi:hypothetical protein